MESVNRAYIIYTFGYQRGFLHYHTHPLYVDKYKHKLLMTYFQGERKRDKSTFLQGWEFAHSLNAHSFICSFSSNQMSDCERFAQITHDKWVTVSKSLRSLKTNEWPWANRSGCSWQMSDHERFAQVTHDKWAKNCG